MSHPARPRPLPGDAVERALDRAAGSRTIPGNRLRLLFDGPEAFAAMEELIGSASRWIHFDNYIIRDDATGLRFARALAARAREGIAVRVSTDWLGSLGTGRRYWRDLGASGATVRQFNGPRPFDLPSLLSRNHRKVVVVDGTRAIIGGLCIGDEWAGDPARGRLPWRDTAALVEGPAAAALDGAFARTWAASGAPLPAAELAGDVASMGDARVRVLAGEPARERAYRVTELLIAAAADRVWITDAYLVAPRRLFRYLVDAARDGVDVRLLVPGSSDLPLVRNLTRFGYRDLLRAGVRIFEWTGPMLHAKTVVADNLWVRVGSSNLNHSSLVGNYELDLLIESDEMADQMEARFRRDLEASAEVLTRAVRAPRQIGRLLPAALEIEKGDRTGGGGRGDEPRPAHRKGIRERGGRSVLAMRTLVASARLAIFGPIALILATLGILFLLVPALMALIFGLFSLWLALVSGAEAIRRRSEPGVRGEQG
jgi:cardiolipin synthase